MVCFLNISLPKKVSQETSKIPNEILEKSWSKDSVRVEVVFFGKVSKMATFNDFSLPWFLEFKLLFFWLKHCSYSEIFIKGGENRRHSWKHSFCWDEIHCKNQHLDKNYTLIFPHTSNGPSHLLVFRQDVPCPCYFLCVNAKSCQGPVCERGKSW